MRNDCFAAAVIWSAYCGYCSATPSAPANDFVSWLCVLSVTSLLDPAIALAMAEA